MGGCITVVALLWGFTDGWRDGGMATLKQPWTSMITTQNNGVSSLAGAILISVDRMFLALLSAWRFKKRAPRLKAPSGDPPYD